MTRRTKASVTLVVALSLTLGMLAQVFTASAAPQLNNVDWSAIFFAQNVELQSAQPGDEFQFIALYTNLGQKAWVKGQAGAEARLAHVDNTRFDSSADHAAGWAVSWLAPDRMAAQDESVVQPGSEASFIWRGKVPANAAAGQKKIMGRPVIDGSRWLEDYGYYQGFSVSAPPPQADCTEPMPENRGCVTGTVTTASGSPAVNICVDFGTTGGCNWRTNSQGVYTTSNLPGGQWDIFFDQNAATKTRITIENGKILTFNFQLP